MPTRLTDIYTWAQIGDLFYERYGDQIGRKDIWVNWFSNQQAKGNGRLLFGGQTYVYCYKVYMKLKKQRMDHFTVVCGKEGTGKSTLAVQLAVTVSDDMTLARILFEPTDFLKCVEESHPGQTTIADEGALFLFSRNAMKGTNVDTITIMQLMRQQYTHTLVCIPRWTDLDKYVRDHRADSAFFIRTTGDFRVIIGDGLGVLNNKYPHKQKNLFACTIPAQFVFDDYNSKIFPKYNDISEDEYKKRKKANYLQRSRETRAKMARNVSLTPKQKSSTKTTLDKQDIDNTMEVY